MTRAHVFVVSDVEQERSGGLGAGHGSAPTLER